MELLVSLVAEEDSDLLTTLEDHILHCGGKLPQEDFQAIMLQFLNGLSYAHDFKICIFT